MNPMKRIILLSILTCLFVCTPLYADDTADDNTGRDDTQVYHVYGNVDLVSSMKFQYGAKPKIFVKYVYPQLEVDSDSLSNNVGIDNFNKQVMDMIQQEITQFKSQAKAGRKNDLYIDYDTSIIRADGDYIISIRFSMQEFIAGMAHPFHFHRVINFNLNKNETITLQDLFQPNADYLDLLSKYSSFALNRRLSDKQLIAKGTAPKPENFNIWNIKPNGLLITFDEYQVAPHINGAQTVLVPFSELKRMISPDSPIADCINHRRSCARSNLLTGGFIDEAAVVPVNGDMVA